MIFGTHWEYRGNSTEYQWEVATVMQGESSQADSHLLYTDFSTDLWLSFAADKSVAPAATLPDGSTFTWQEYAVDEATLAQFAEGDVIVDSVDAAFIDDTCTTS